MTSREAPQQQQQHLQPLPHPYNNTFHAHNHPQPPPPPPHPNHHRETANASPIPVACFMERTPSGRTILTETTTTSSSTDPSSTTLPPDQHHHHQVAVANPQHTFSPEQDRDAARRVKQHMLKPASRVRHHERILRALIHPRARATEFPLDHDALESIFRAADEIFFQGKLSRRVHWEWSSFADQQLQGGAGGARSRIIGTTALRHAPGERGGYETLIVLSSPILTDTSYNRRLLISTFLHELIHSYLFICCGFKARHCGGHTEGFLKIARLIDEWAGWGTLKLCEVEADLEHFREEPLPLEEPLSPARSLVVDGYELPQQQPQLQQQRYHHHGGQDFYDLNNPMPWSTGPKMVFGAHHQGGDGGEWGMGCMTPMSMATTLVGHDGWDESSEHTFTDGPMKPF